MATDSNVQNITALGKRHERVVVIATDRMEIHITSDSVNCPDKLTVTYLDPYTEEQDDVSYGSAETLMTYLTDVAGVRLSPDQAGTLRLELAVVELEVRLDTAERLRRKANGPARPI